MAVPGERLAARYELIEQIGAGGMATVWRGRDTRLGRQVAIKLLRPELGEDVELARRFATEARHAASVAHPNVATVFDTDIDGDQPFIVMELVDGPSVAELLASEGPLEPRIAVEMAASAARALAAAHRRGLIHRDVKPANLLVGRDGRVRLADFGIARALTSSRVTAPGTVLGSIPYLSPEQAEGSEATAAGDIFSLGVVLFEMLTGRLPWEADTAAALATVRLHVPAPAPSRIVRSLPDGLDQIVGRALARDPADRYPSARVFADSLQAWNRRNRPASGQKSVIGATTALVRRAAPERRPSIPRLAAATAAASGVAAPNPWVQRPFGGGATRRRQGQPTRLPRPAATPPPPAAALPPQAADRLGDEPEARRRSGLLLGIVALGLLFAVGIGFLLRAGGGAPPGPSGLGAAPAASPTPPAAAPTPTPTLAIVVVPGPSPTASPAPTPTPTTRPVPRPTTAPTPRPPRPTPTPTARSAAATAVLSFYDAVEAHDWDRAIALWSPSMQRRYPPQEWLIDRFERTTRIDITRLRTVSFSPASGTARVEVTLVEYRTVEPSPRTFVGAWDLVLIDGRWVLDDPDF